MQLYFIDDSGTICPPNKIIQSYFVLGGLAIPEEQWRNLEISFSQICSTFKVCGEIKWRFFGQKPGREDKENTLSHLNIIERDKLRKELLLALVLYDSIKIIVGAIHLPSIYNSLEVITPEHVHALTYKSLITSYQHRLQELSQNIGSTINGIIISDHRNPLQDTALRKLHMNILKSESIKEPKYPNLIESLFLAPSHHSIGIQFADLISGAMFRYFEHGDDRWYKMIESSFWKSPTGQIEGYGLIRIPSSRKEKDAESAKPFDSAEPALLTQSQRTSNHTAE
jgi:hypothetical protein